MFRTFIIFCSFCFFSLVIVPQAAGQRTDQGLPPAEIIADSYHSASAVFCMDVDTTRISDSVMTDSGRTGYVCLQFDGTLKESYKGTYAEGSRICIDNWIEYNPQLLTHWRDQEEILIFIDRIEGTKKCFRAMENGMFLASETLKDLIRKLK